MKNIQNHLLNELRIESTPVVIFLTSGFQIRGLVKGFDNYVVLLDVEGKQQMVFKHAISTFVPSKTVALPEEE